MLAEHAGRVMAMKLEFGRRLPMLRQFDSTGSGRACLAMIAGYHGDKDGFSTAPLTHTGSPLSLSVAQLVQMAGCMDLNCRPLRIDAAELRELSMPAVLQWHGGHYVVLKSMQGHRLMIHDPGAGPMGLDVGDAACRFSGIAIEIDPSNAFCDRIRPQPAAWAVLGGRLGQQNTLLRPVLLPVLLLSLALATIALRGPFFIL